MIDKQAIREQFRRHERDTGSSEVQIATLTKRIEQLTEHLKANKKDNSSRYGLIRMVRRPTARSSPTSACAAEPAAATSRKGRRVRPSFLSRPGFPGFPRAPERRAPPLDGARVRQRAAAWGLARVRRPRRRP